VFPFGSEPVEIAQGYSHHSTSHAPENNRFEKDPGEPLGWERTVRIGENCQKRGRSNYGPTEAPYCPQNQTADEEGSNRYGVLPFMWWSSVHVPSPNHGLRRFSISTFRTPAFPPNALCLVSHTEHSRESLACQSSALTHNKGIRNGFVDSKIKGIRKPRDVASQTKEEQGRLLTVLTHLGATSSRPAAVNTRWAAWHQFRPLQDVRLSCYRSPDVGSRRGNCGVSHPRIVAFSPLRHLVSAGHRL